MFEWHNLGVHNAKDVMVQNRNLAPFMERYIKILQYLLTLSYIYSEMKIKFKEINLKIDLHD